MMSAKKATDKRFKRLLRTATALAVCLAIMTSYYVFAADTSGKESTTAKAETTTSYSAVADKELKDLQNQYDKLEKKISQNEKKLDKVESSKASEESKVKKLNSEIADLNSQISILDERVSVLDDSIEKLSNSISKLDGDIDALDKEINKINYDITVTKSSISDRYEQLKQRLRAAYMAGNVSDLQILLSSGDFSTFLNNAEMIKKVTEYDISVIDGLEADLQQLNDLNTRCSNSKKELSNKVDQLSSEKKEISAKKSDVKSSEELLASKQAAAAAKRAESQKVISELDKDSKEFKEAIAAYEAEQRRVEAEMDRIILERGSTTNDKVEDSNDNEGDSSSGEVKSSGKYVKEPLKNMQWPVPYKNCYVSAGFGYYSPFGVKQWHSGMDICVRGGSEGKDIVAAQNGKVIKTGYGDSSRGNYILIDHGSGVTTAYYHCKKLFVKEGQFVDKGTRIALIGQTGNVTGPHLHFGVHISNGSKVEKVDPAKYVSMP